MGTGAEREEVAGQLIDEVFDGQRFLARKVRAREVPWEAIAPGERREKVCAVNMRCRDVSYVRANRFL